MFWKVRAMPSVERACQFHPLLQPVRQTPDRGLADVLDLQEIDDMLDFFAMFQFFPLVLAPVEHLREQ